MTRNLILPFAALLACVCGLHTQVRAEERPQAVIDAVNDSGEALFQGTRWQGKFCMRISVSSWRTDDEDVRRTIEAVKATLSSLATNVS